MKKEYPYQHLIVPNSTITLRSVFDFADGYLDLFPFLQGCKVNNCIVIFSNENITIRPTDNETMNGGANNIKLSVYLMVANDSTIVRDYLRYMTDCIKLNTDDFNKRTPTLLHQDNPNH